MAAAHPFDTVAPPARLPRAPGWRDRVRARRARRRGVVCVAPATVVIGRGVRFDVAPGARVVLDAGVVLGDGCRFHVTAGEVHVGAGTVLGERCVIAAQERVVVGAHCRLGDEVVLADADHRFDDVERPVRLQGVHSAPVIVGDAVRIGPRAALMRGVTVGARAAVGAQAVVTHDIAPGAVVDGVPAAPAPATPPGSRPAPGGRAPR